MRPSLVHISTGSGHRPSYADLFARLFDLQPSLGPIRGRAFWRLVGAHRLLFATIDDDYAGFAAVALCRALMGRRTAGLFLRPAQIFSGGDRPVATRAKRALFAVLRRLPGLRLLSIIPFDIRPELARVAHDWAHDPQMWDLWVDGPPSLPETDLSRQVQAQRAGRRVMIFVGRADRAKGFDLFAARAEAEAGQLFCVSAGRVSPECAADARRLAGLGMIVEDRFVTDDEILSLYGVADLAWCHYAPEYDQASGVYGRAVQTGVEPVVRPGSILQAFHDRERSTPPQMLARSIAVIRAAL